LDYRDAEPLGEPEDEIEIEPVNRVDDDYITAREELSTGGREVYEMLADREMEAARRWNEMSEEQQRQDWKMMSKMDRQLLQRAVRKFRQSQQQSQQQSQEQSQSQEKNRSQSQDDSKSQSRDGGFRGR